MVVLTLLDKQIQRGEKRIFFMTHRITLSRLAKVLGCYFFYELKNLEAESDENM
jgi:hypothetical protein